MSNNFTKGVGNLTTNKFDFNNHISGASFKHTASMITLDSPITYHPYWQTPYSPVTNVYDALTTLGTILNVTPPNTSTSAYGLISLVGDISGTDTNIKVVKLYGTPIVDLGVSPPTTGQLLGWDGSVWRPTSLTGINWAGDLAGSNNITQKVVSLTGSSNAVAIKASNLIFDPNLMYPWIMHSPTSGSTTFFTISAQDTANSGGIGGSLILQSGKGPISDNGIMGSVVLSSKTQLLDATSLYGGSNYYYGVLSLCNPNSVTTSQMPYGTGDMVIYIKDAITTPTRAPTGGSILYSNNGTLNIEQADGYNFTINGYCNLGNNNYIPAYSFGEYKYYAQVTTTNSTLQFYYDVPKIIYKVVTFDIKIMARVISSSTELNNAATWNMYNSYTFNFSDNTISDIGTSTLYNVGKIENTSGYFIDPSMGYYSSGKVFINTGLHNSSFPGDQILWTIFIKINIS